MARHAGALRFPHDRGDAGERNNVGAEFSDSQWIAIDLGRSTRISRVELVWEAAYGKAYAIQVSDDGRTWKTVHRTEAGRGDIETIRFLPVEARWVRMLGSKRGSPTGGYSLYEFKVFR